MHIRLSHTRPDRWSFGVLDENNGAELVTSRQCDGRPACIELAKAFIRTLGTCTEDVITRDRQGFRLVCSDVDGTFAQSSRYS
ncbi:MAG: hypothetical protein ACPG4T_03835, partial [Nannocystaceae bacterium]